VSTRSIHRREPSTTGEHGDLQRLEGAKEPATNRDGFRRALRTRAAPGSGGPEEGAASRPMTSVSGSVAQFHEPDGAPSAVRAPHQIRDASATTAAVHANHS